MTFQDFELECAKLCEPKDFKDNRKELQYIPVKDWDLLIDLLKKGVPLKKSPECILFLKKMSEVTPLTIDDILKYHVYFVSLNVYLKY